MMDAAGHSGATLLHTTQTEGAEVVDYGRRAVASRNKTAHAAIARCWMMRLRYGSDKAPHQSCPAHDHAKVFQLPRTRQD